MISMGETIAFIFGLVGLGYLAAWTGLLSKVAGDALTQFATVVAVPALLFKTLSTLDLSNLSPWPLWLAYFSAIPPVWLAGHMVTTRLFRREPAVGVVGGVASSFSNLLLLGIPLILGVFGNPGIEILSLMLAVHLPVMLAASMIGFEWVRRASGEGQPALKVLRDFLGNLLTNPLIVGILAGIAWRLTGLQMPAVPVRIIDAFAATAGSLVLFAMGMSLRGYGLAGDIRPAAVLAILKLCVLPALVLVTVTVVGLAPLPAKVAVVCAAMPTGVNPYLIATRFGVGQRLAANTVTISTLLSIATTVAWLAVAQAIFA